ncbi:MAG: lytic transglycosylase domain-containing protein [Candidatus Paceibacterota bacterium]|jgi:hypothetical protein
METNKKIFVFFRAIIPVTLFVFVVLLEILSMKRDNNYDILLDSLQRNMKDVQLAIVTRDQSYIPDSIRFFDGIVPLHIYGVWEDIDFWVHYYTAPKNRWRTLSYLESKERYFPRLDSVLVEQKVSRDAKYVALAESELNPVVVSSAKAKGGWQFIQSTGKRNKLIINSNIDGRLHFEESTIAACNELKSLQKEFNQFGLFDAQMFALAGYNAGSGTVWKAIKKDRERSYFLLSSLPKETEQYIPRIIALKLILENSERYGFIKGVTFGGPSIQLVEYSTKRFESWEQLAKRFDISAKEMRRANAHILNKEGISKGNYTLRIPERKN